jgi:hypothetical protein
MGISSNTVAESIKEVIAEATEFSPEAKHSSWANMTIKAVKFIFSTTDYC